MVFSVLSSAVAFAAPPPASAASTVGTAAASATGMASIASLPFSSGPSSPATFSAALAFPGDTAGDPGPGRDWRGRTGRLRRAARPAPPPTLPAPPPPPPPPSLRQRMSRRRAPAGTRYPAAGGGRPVRRAGTALCPVPVCLVLEAGWTGCPPGRRRLRPAAGYLREVGVQRGDVVAAGGAHLALVLRQRPRSRGGGRRDHHKLLKQGH